MALSTVAKAVKPKTYNELQAKVFRCLAKEEILLIYIKIEEIGASVILRGLAEAMQSNGKQSFKFDKMIQVRTKQSMREIQREIALALNLDSSIMTMFDEYDEIDDFRGVLARDPIPPVANEIYRILKDSRFLLTIYDYSVDLSIDLAVLGVPFAKWSGQKILWIAEYNYVMASRKLRTVMEPDVFLYMEPADSAAGLDCAYEEASEIAYHVNKRCGKSILTPPVIFQCMWYQTVIAYFSEKHNIQHIKYCMCEGIIEKNAAREIQNMLPQKVLAKITRKPINSLIWDALMLDSKRKWTRPELLPPKTIVVLESSRIYALPPDAENYRSLLVKIDSFYNWDKLQWGSFSNVSSVFMGCPAKARLATPDNLFRQLTNLRVLHLFRCIVSFMPHSFLGLHNLRFLRLESCTLVENKNRLNELQQPMIHSPAIVEEGEGQRLASLLILDLFDNNFGSLTSEALELMPNLEEINMVKSTSRINLEAPQGLANLQKLELVEAGLENVHDGFFERMKKLQVLNLSGNRHTKCVPKSLSMATSLKELILDECEDLEILNLNLPASLELISLQGCASLKEREFVLPPLPNLKTFRHTLSQITMLSLQGCTKLEDINLNELHELEVLNLSRTALKYLPLGTIKTPKLKQLILLGCEQLKRITWDGLQPPLVGLFIDNCSSSREDRCRKSFKTRKEPHTAEDGDNIRFFEAHIVMRDARFLQSLIRAFSNLQKANIHIHIHVSSSAASSISSSATRMISPSKKESLAAFDSCQHAYYYPMIKGHAQNELPPPSPPLDGHIEVDGDSGFPTEIKELMRLAKSLYVHNNASIVTINHPMRHLKQCWVERCYNMDTIFTPTEENDNALEFLEIIWANNLLRLNAACKEGINLGLKSFSRLRRIYLEFCPRLKFVFPSNLELSNLETINIRNCGDLREVFFDQREDGGRSPKSLQKLSSICLQELPKLQYICKSSISCPVLKELKFRGCWSLRKFPILYPSDHTLAKALKITCEKDWWEKLEWDGLEANKFNPSHSPYYKKRLKSRYL